VIDDRKAAVRLLARRGAEPRKPDEIAAEEDLMGRKQAMRFTRGNISMQMGNVAEGVRERSRGSGEERILAPADFSDMRSFRRFLEAASSKIPGEEFLTSSSEHTAAVVDFLFEHTEGVVEILTDRLDPAIYAHDDAIHGAKAFLDRTRAAYKDHPSIFILYEAQVNLNEHLLLKEVRGVPGWDKAVSFKRVPGDLTSQYTSHFVVSDAKHFMFQPERTTPGALVQFNAPEFSARLHSGFGELWHEVVGREHIGPSIQTVP